MIKIWIERASVGSAHMCCSVEVSVKYDLILFCLDLICVNIESIFIRNFEI